MGRRRGELLFARAARRSRWIEKLRWRTLRQRAQAREARLDKRLRCSASVERGPQGQALAPVKGTGQFPAGRTKQRIIAEDCGTTGLAPEAKIMTPTRATSIPSLKKNSPSRKKKQNSVPLRVRNGPVFAGMRFTRKPDRRDFVAFGDAGS